MTGWLHNISSNCAHVTCCAFISIKEMVPSNFEYTVYTDQEFRWIFITLAGMYIVFRDWEFVFEYWLHLQTKFKKILSCCTKVHKFCFNTSYLLPTFYFNL